MLPMILVSALTSVPAPAGEIVFVKREKETNVVYKMPAAGGTAVRLFGNSDKVNSNCLFPRWSADGKEIHFTAMNDGYWVRWAMGADGSEPHVIHDEEVLLESHETRSSDLEVGDDGVLFRVGKDGKKTKLYKVTLWMDGDGPREATWDPSHTFVVFEACSGVLSNPCKLIVVDGDGKNAHKLGPGMEPDWSPGH